MTENRYLKNIIRTIVSKSLILGLNFLLVVLTTHLWGAEGRGIISIVIADVAIIVIVNNILAGSAVSYMVPKTGVSPLLLPAYLWIVVFSFAGTLFFGWIHDGNRLFLLGLAILTSVLGVNSMIFVGSGNIKWYNNFNTLLPLLHLIFILLLKYFGNELPVGYYFFALLVSLAIVIVVSWLKVRPLVGDKLLSFQKSVVKTTFDFGWKNELSYLLQFLNYRFSYFLILYFNEDYHSVGVFSVGVALAESIWLFSRSISINQYSSILNHSDNETAKKLTIQSAKLSIYVSLLITGALLLMPAKLYGFIFGAEFSSVKSILFMLAPGIIAIAISNIYGHFFAAIGQQRTLIVKSIVGLTCNIILSFALIPVLSVTGACMAVSVSYLASSVYLGMIFYRNSSFKKSDFIITKDDIKLLKR
jgi:O-antigen/teichoic acid export membrane protein